MFQDWLKEIREIEWKIKWVDDCPKAGLRTGIELRLNGDYEGVAEKIKQLENKEEAGVYLHNVIFGYSYATEKGMGPSQSHVDTNEMLPRSCSKYCEMPCYHIQNGKYYFGKKEK